MTVEVRLAVLEDEPHLKRWLNDPKILRWFPMMDVREVEDSVRIWMSYVRLKGGLTACLDGVPVGMANLYLQPYKKFMHQCLFSIIVEEKYRGKGIGKALLEHLIKLAKEEHQMEFLHLEVYDGNPAIHLYQRTGFKEYGCHRRFIKTGGEYIDKILMQKEL